MVYTINGKQYSEFDINKQCAELKIAGTGRFVATHHNLVFIDNHFCGQTEYNPCNNPSDTWPIIEKCWDELNRFANFSGSRWIFIMQKHNCTKLVAACICFIEMAGE